MVESGYCESTPRSAQFPLGISSRHTRVHRSRWHSRSHRETTEHFPELVGQGDAIGAAVAYAFIVVVAFAVGRPDKSEKSETL